VDATVHFPISDLFMFLLSAKYVTCNRCLSMVKLKFTFSITETCCLKSHSVWVKSLLPISTTSVLILSYQTLCGIQCFCLLLTSQVVLFHVLISPTVAH
jgi:hypothetical protein